MEECLLTSKGETRARLMLGELSRKGIPAGLRRLPLELTREGCAHGVAVSVREREQAMRILKLAGLAPRRVYCGGKDGWEVQG